MHVNCILHGESLVTLHIFTIYSSPLDKMAAISQTTVSNEFPWMKSFVFWFEFHRSFSLIDNDCALVQVNDWRLIADKPLHEPMLIQFTDAYMRH